MKGLTICLLLCRLLFAAGTPLSALSAAEYDNFGNYCGKIPQDRQGYIINSIKDHEAVLNISSDERYCAHADENNVRISRTYHRTSYGDMPIIAISDNLSKLKMINIFLTGGPRQEAAEMLRNKAYKNRIISNLLKGSVWIFPSYFSTKERSLYPKPDLYHASLELIQYIKFMKSRHPNAKIRLVGLSLGRYLVPMISDRAPWDAMFLVSPLMSSVDELESYFVKKHGTDWGKLPQMRIFEIPGDRGTIAFRDIDQLDYFRKMRAGLPKRTIFELLKPGFPKCIDIIYGDKDDRIGISIAEAARRSNPWIRFHVKKKHEHYWNKPADIDYMFDLLDRQDCMKRKIFS